MNSSESRRAPRLSKAHRRTQLLNVAMRIVRDEGADRLTLGYLASSAGVSKPVAYEHFATRSALLIELYRWIDTERVAAFRTAMTKGDRTAEETVTHLAAVYIACAADRADEFHAVGAALAGSEEKAAVYRELLDNVVDMFADVIRPHSTLERAALGRMCMALAGAGEALAEGIVREELSEAQAIAAFERFIRATL